MINIRIYCSKTHPEYENTYNIINDIMRQKKMIFSIERIYEAQTIQQKQIKHLPHIVINNQVVFMGGSLSIKDVNEIIKRL